MSAGGPRAAVGCCEPTLGLEVHACLGRALPSDLRAHVEICLACRLERLEFDRFDRFDGRPGSRQVGRVGD